MSILAMSRGSGTAGLLEQPPAPDSDPPDHSADATAAPPHTSSLKPRPIMSTTVSTRSIVVPVSDSVHSPPPPSRTDSGESRFSSIRDFLSRVDDITDIATVQRELLHPRQVR